MTPSPPPVPPPARLVGAPTLLDRFLILVIPTAAVGLLVSLAAVFFFTPTPAAPMVHGSPCTAPTEHEQLLVVIGWHSGRLAAECIYLGSRGTYSRRTVRHLVAK